MKRARNKSALPRLSRDAERLVHLSQGMSASGSRVEDGFWEVRIAAELDRLLDNGADVAIDSALDMLFATLPPAYDVLIDLVETHAESATIASDAGPQQVLLVAAPILAWSKYAIFSGALRADTSEALQAHLYAHVAAEGVRIALAPYLFSIDQLPRSFSQTRTLARNLGRRALGADVRAIDVKHMPETAPLLADARFLIAAFVAAPGAPMFRWQENAEAPKAADRSNREQVLERWRTQGQPNLTPVMSGCVLDLLIPDGYHAACRESDRDIRPYGIRAAIAFLETTLSIEPKQLRAVVAPFGIDRAEEYRIGFTRLHNPDVLHGVVWPLYGSEDGREPGGPQEQIEMLLRACEIGDVRTMDPLYPMEFCEDCGAPMFADPLGDLVHAEMPEDVEAPRAHLH